MPDRIIGDCPCRLRVWPDEQRRIRSAFRVDAIRPAVGRSAFTIGLVARDVPVADPAHGDGRQCGRVYEQFPRSIAAAKPVVIAAICRHRALVGDDLGRAGDEACS
jgi:hypothetical protein